MGISRSRAQRRPGAERAARIASLLVLVCGLPGTAATDGDGLALWPEGDGILTTTTSQAVRIPTAALILSGESGGDLDAALLATPFPGVGADALVSLMIEVEGAPLLAASRSATPALDIVVYALDAHGLVVTQSVQALTLPPETHDALAARGLRVLSSIELPPGTYSVRLLVRVRDTDLFSLRTRTVVVPAPATEARPDYLAPWVLVPFAPRLLALPEGESVGAARGIQPLRLDGELWLAQTEPVLTPGQPARVSLLTVSPPAQGAAAVVRLEGTDGSPAAEAQATTGHPTPTSRLELQAVPLLFDVPPVPGGRYRLRVDLSTAGAGSISQALEVAIAGTDDERPLQTALERATAPAAGNVRGERRQFAQAYRQALGALASGAEAEARALVVALELSALRSTRRTALQDLDRVEWESLNDLATESWDHLIPVLELHSGLVETYRAEKLSPLAEHAMRMSRRLAKAIGNAAASESEKRDAAQVLVEVAGHLHATARFGEAQEIFEAAVALDDKHATALLSLAIGFEYRGLYEPALKQLERLVRAYPRHPEGRLRLAINLRRAGKERRALALLRELTDEPTEWVALVAVQELARSELRRGEPQRAVATLEGALERWPLHAALELQLAYVLDDLGQRRAASELVEALVGRPAPLADSAHFRYNRWRVAAPGDESRHLAAGTDGRLQKLDRSLNGTPGEESE